MQNAFVTMLEMQDRMNSKVHPDWVNQHYEWYRAIWIECGELIDHYGYKWWKKQHSDIDQVRLEVIDIWHFGMSALMQPDISRADTAHAMSDALKGYHYAGTGVREATEMLALYALQKKSFSVPLFWELLTACGMQFEDLYQQYVGKNVLNFFRQDNGYKEGHYVKQWQGREDNEHLVEILLALDSASPTFKDDIYAALRDRYEQVSV